MTKSRTEVHPDGYKGDFVIATTGAIPVRGDGVFGGLTIMTSESLTRDEIAYADSEGRWHILKLPAPTGNRTGTASDKKHGEP